MSVKIGIDLMGSENDPKEILKSIHQFTKDLKQDVHFIFFAHKDLFSFYEELKKDFINSEAIFTQHTISMDEDPLLAIRRKKDSSMMVGINFLKENKIDALISCGNTGALMISAKTIIGTFDTISRPALLAMIPTKTNLTAILDVGASASFTSDNLVQFALLGAAFQKAKKISNPKVGLLNIGTEEKKGTSVHQEAYVELSKLKDDFNFVGNIEGKQVFDGLVDVLVTDGFTGNVFLKTAEGIASFVLDKIYENLGEKDIKEIVKILDELKKKLYYGEYPGAVLLGIEKIIIKCHGYSSIKAIISAIQGSIDFVENDIISKTKSHFIK